MPLTVLLNMIVKNEAHIIEKTLTMLCDKIKFSYWVISDTGSTDTTKDIIIEFFKKRGIEGELFDDDWKDFGHNRTKALEHAYGKSDLLFIFDADDDLVGNFKVPKKIYDSYYLKFGSGYSINYWRICMVNNRKKWKYVGVIHEYIECLESPVNKFNIEGEYYIIHGTSGDRSNDHKKYGKDAAILEKAFKELDVKDKLRNRYAFYCANSYRDSGEVDRAIVWYKIAINLDGGWDQEKYKACTLLHDIYKKKDKHEDAMFYALQSYKFDKTRVEGIYRLVNFYCISEMYHVAFAYYSLISEWYENIYMKSGSNFSDKLFVEIMDYDLQLPYYLIIVAIKVGKPEVGIKMYDFLFRKKKIDVRDPFIHDILHNFQFITSAIDKTNIAFISHAKDYIMALEGANIPVNAVFKNIIDGFTL